MCRETIVTVAITFRIGAVTRDKNRCPDKVLACFHVAVYVCIYAHEARCGVTSFLLVTMCLVRGNRFLTLIKVTD